MAAMDWKLTTHRMKYFRAKKNGPDESGPFFRVDRLLLAGDGSGAFADRLDDRADGLHQHVHLLRQGLKFRVLLGQVLLAGADRIIQVLRFLFDFLAQVVGDLAEQLGNREQPAMATALARGLGFGSAIASTLRT